MKKSFVRKRKFIILFWGICVCFVILLLISIFHIPSRVDILTDYMQLVSDQDTLLRLEYVPPTKDWKPVSFEDENAITIGYASFTFPFGDIVAITNEYTSRVRIISDDVTVTFSSLIVLDEFTEVSNNDLWTLTYKAGSIIQREEKYRKYDIALKEFEVNTPPYEFHKKIFELKPKPVVSLLFMNFKDLYIYEKMLEIKNYDLKSDYVCLYLTDNIKGVAESLLWVTNEDKYKSGYMILIWNMDEKVYQLVQILSYFENIDEETIQKFISSFSFDMQTIEANRDDIRPVVLEALQENKNYFPSFDND